MTPILSIQGLRKRFGERQVLNGFDLQVSRGEIVALLGPNGCGKSTVLNTVAQLLRPDAGQIQLLGEGLGDGSRARIGFCAQDSALYPDLLPAENLDFFARLYGVPAAQRPVRVAELMQRFGLAPHALTRVGRLSGGWKQRLHLAVALVHRPDLLVLDEPTGAVDVVARLDLWALIEDLRDAGTTVLMTTHQLAEAERLCTRVAVMRQGRVAAQGTVAELLALVQGRAVAVVQTPDPAALRQRVQLLGWSVQSHAAAETDAPRAGVQPLICLLPQALSLREVVDALDGVPVSAVSVQPVSLEHVYLQLMSAA